MTLTSNRKRLTTPALLSVAAVTALLQACSSTQLAEPKAASMTPTTAAATPGTRSVTPVARTEATPESSVRTVTLPAYLDPKNPLSTARSVFFDFDTFGIKDDYSTVIERHGRFLASNPALAIKIEGSSDERGSVEYNLALGQKRAQAVLGALKVYGVKDTQMEAVSWGEEKPMAQGHDESAWAQNRRADLRYPTK